ncbi:GntR family transcriptional regulator [Georgenia sp. SYP-B2076]|uniref:GntR family transcriptional regulator n=1 Tax=Georgenia sp. SYP-B2076 TaxID=2495881 RepID=UPI000F8CE0D2|nr:GntR family transcriptional regulator [Georgenia sp. SYP-B2076]
MVIKRTALRAQVREELLERMRSGAVHPGQTINEVQLAAELGVSRTPLREALISLETEGQIASESGRGFRFLPLSARELEELSPIIAALECLALELSPPEELAELGRNLLVLARDFKDEVAQHALINQRDDEWHTLMLSACPNGRLMDHLQSVRLALHRYESLLVHDEAMVARSSAEHEAIAQRLVDGDLAGAQAALRANWRNGARRLLQTLDFQTDRAS